MSTCHKCFLPLSHARNNNVPSTREVRRVTLAALRLPAGKAMPILSSLSRRFRPPSFDLALKIKPSHVNLWKKKNKIRRADNYWNPLIHYRRFWGTIRAIMRSFEDRLILCLTSWELRLRARRSSILVEIASVGPRLQSLCTWMWSWAATACQERNKRCPQGRWLIKDRLCCWGLVLWYLNRNRRG